MADLDVLKRSIEQAQDVSGQLVEDLRSSLVELEEMHKDIRHAQSLAQDVPGVDDMLEQFNDTYETAHSMVLQVGQTVKNMQASMAGLVGTIAGIAGQQERAQAKTKTKQASGGEDKGRAPTEGK